MRELPNICACDPAQRLIANVSGDHSQVQQRRQELLSPEQMEALRKRFDSRPDGVPVRMLGVDYYGPEPFLADIAKSNERAFCRDERFLAELEGRLGQVMLNCSGIMSCTAMGETITACSSLTAVEALQEDLDTHFWRFFD